MTGALEFSTSFSFKFQTAEKQSTWPALLEAQPVEDGYQGERVPSRWGEAQKRAETTEQRQLVETPVLSAACLKTKGVHIEF